MNFDRNSFTVPHAKRFLLVAVVCASVVSGGFAATIVQEKEGRRVKKVTRVKKPEYSKRDWDGIYFENLFEDGLVGQRPKAAAPGTVSGKTADAAAAQEGEAGESAGLGWAQLISRSTLEDEVKNLQKQLGQQITTPIKFKSEYGKAHHSFSILSMTFGIIREYEDEVRWKKFSGEAQASFQKAAANSRVGTIQAYESCKRRKGDLDEMVRGGNFVSDDKAPEDLDWSAVIERGPVMDRLQESQNRLKQMTANKDDFLEQIEDVVHESEMITAMAIVLTKENMSDADDEGYVEFAIAMNKAALEIVQACQTEDYDRASNAANAVSQSCDNCHEEWR